MISGALGFPLSEMYKSESESCSVVSNSLQPHGLYSPWSSPHQNTGVGSRSLLQGTFPIQGSNPGLPNCRLSHKGSPRNVLYSLTEEMKFSYCPVGKVTKILF